ncbi:MAG: cobyrinate a,c-diamide synthase [Lachnospiraceae bacterium]|nr:cobyrinate a,c-diamide synthase [Lachnospiraceae bacterium]
MGRVLLAGASSGSGKTIITCGLLEALKKKGLSVSAYKCGPDYIDPMFHRSVIGVSSENLDSFFMDEIMLNTALGRGEKTDISVIEGAMGIFDGISGLRLEGSAYDIARLTNTPIILIMDVHGMGRTMVSLIKGILADDECGLIKGIVLNRISKGYFESIKTFIEDETKVPVVGYLEKLKGVNLESRHLGLKMPHEIDNLKEEVERVASNIEKSFDLEKIVEISNEASFMEKKVLRGTAGCEVKNALEAGAFFGAKNAVEVGDSGKISSGIKKVRLGVAKDEVFCFYYEENLRLLEEYGAELIYFSPLHDKCIPEGVSGLLIGGGYPELRLKELSENVSMKASIKNAIDNNMPTIAECGGFMYLHKAIVDNDGAMYEMVGAIDAKAYNEGKLVRFGYVEISMDSYEVKGHEFHYFDSEKNGSDAIARKPFSDKKWSFGYVDENRIWGFPHLYYGSCESLPRDFVNAMRKYSSEKYAN